MDVSMGVGTRPLKAQRTPRQAIALAGGVAAVYLVAATLAGLAAKAWLPQYQPEFVALVVMALLVAGALTALRWWGPAGFNGPQQWRELRLLILPLAVFALLPLLGGVNWLGWDTTLYLVVAYLLTGFMEEGLFRGIVLRVLGPLGPTGAVALSSLLFALVHIGNVLYRSPAIVLAQMVGAFCDGFGLGALRLRTNTIWGVIGLHAVHDLVLRYSKLPTIPVDVVQVTIMLVYGIWLLRAYQKTMPG